jgi:hypothetical protein
MKLQSGYALLLAPGALVAALLCGCEVNTHHHDGTNNDDVKISTPFGAMSVKTNDTATQANVGLSVYPGATLEKKLKKQSDGKTEEDSNAADINMSFGSFHLGVKAVSYFTPDSSDKVLNFYRKDLARYGVVLFCKDHHAVGTPTVTQDGLTCSDDHHNKISVDDDDAKQRDGELRAGSKQHQHIVAVDSEGSGTKIGLVMLDLPAHLGSGDDDSRQ